MSGLDGYELYRLLKDGNSRSNEVNGSSYTLWCKGTPLGSNKWLEVTAESSQAQTRSEGSSAVCWNYLSDLERDWSSPQ